MRFHRLLVAAAAVLVSAGCFERAQHWTLVVAVPLLVYVIVTDEISVSVDPASAPRRRRSDG